MIGFLVCFKVITVCYLLGDEEDDSDRRNSRNLESEDVAMSKKERNKVIETEDASRGPLSGCIRLADSSRVIQRLKVGDLLYCHFKPVLCV